MFAINLISTDIMAEIPMSFGSFKKGGNVLSQQKGLSMVLLSVWLDMVGFYGISTIVRYLMLNPLYTYVLNIYDLFWLDFMAYQPLYAI